MQTQQLPTDPTEARTFLRRFIDAEWKRQGRERDPVVYEYAQWSNHPDEQHFIKVVYSVSDPTFGVGQPFIRHTLNLKDGGMFNGHYDLDKSEMF